jgi:hypothetical protein
MGHRRQLQVAIVLFILAAVWAVMQGDGPPVALPPPSTLSHNAMEEIQMVINDSLTAEEWELFQKVLGKITFEYRQAPAEALEPKSIFP